MSREDHLERRKSPELLAARAAVAGSLEDEDTAALFGEPVDPGVLPDYLSIIKEPKDLGTVLEDLDKSIKGAGPYRNAKDVFRDVQLIWFNCRRYNNRPEDKPIVDICRYSSKLFNEEWRKAGLLVPSVSPGNATSARRIGKELSTAPEGRDRDVESLPLRLLTNFEVGGALPDTLAKLDSLGAERAAGREVTITGYIVQPSGVQPKRPLQPLLAERIVDWVVEYNDTDDGHEGAAIWIVTATAWYKLLEPSERYASLYKEAVQGAALAQAVLAEIAAGEDPSDPPALIDNVTAHLSDIGPEVKQFAQLQVDTRLGRRKPKGRNRRGGGVVGGSSIKRARGGQLGKVTSRSRLGQESDGDYGLSVVADEVDAMSDDDMPDDFEISDEENVDAYEGPGKARRRAWRRIKYWRRRAEEDARRQREEAEILEREHLADEARGPPPQPISHFRVPREHVADLLEVWEFAQAFGDVMQLAPFSLTALEAALDPGPRLRHVASPRRPKIKKDNHDDQKQLPIVAQEVQEGDEIKDKEDDQEESDVPELKLEEPPPQVAENKTPEKPEKCVEKTGNEQKEEEQQEEEGKAGAPQADMLPSSEPAPSLPVKRKRGRPRKDSRVAAHPSMPGAGIIDQRRLSHGAPQNVVDDPTIKTRRQKGVKIMASAKAREMLGRGNPASGAAPGAQVKVKLTGTAAKAAASPDNPVSAALLAAQAARDAYVAMLQEKYGLSGDITTALMLIDRDYAASAVLLRDLVTALARAAAGDLPGRIQATMEQNRPRTAKLNSPDNDGIPWPERLSVLAWNSLDASPEARQAALKLAYGDWMDLMPGEKLALLVAALHAALRSEVVQNEIMLRVDQCTASITRRDGGAGDEQEDDGGRLAAAAASAAALPPPLPSLNKGALLADDKEKYLKSGGPNPLQLWRRWYSAQNLGVRRALGIDFRGRRYFALGQDAGAFRVFCEEPESGDWGWYEGEGIQALGTWLASGVGIRCEASLLSVLRSAPLPLSNPTPAAPARPLVGTELVAHRADGFRGLTLPALRAEWNGARRESLPANSPTEHRVLLAVESMLGSVPYWFAGDTAIRRVQATLDVLAMTQYGRDAARALLEAERYLFVEGRLSEEWSDVWQKSWRHAVAMLVDLRDVPMYVATLQTHLVSSKLEDVLPRPAFMKIAAETNCILDFPALGQEVVLLRGGLLQHLHRYMQLLQIDKPDSAFNATQFKEIGQPNIPAQKRSDGQLERGPSAPSTQAEGAVGANEDLTDSFFIEESLTALGSPRNDDTPSNSPSLATIEVQCKGTVQPSGPRVCSDAAAKLKTQWESLRARVQALRPIGRYLVQGIVYRRHLADAADLEDHEISAAAPRSPVAWILLRPARFGPSHQLPASSIVVPLAVVKHLPDYMLKVSEFVEGTRVAWQPGDRFRAFFGGKISLKTQKKLKSGGSYHKGEVISVVATAPGPTASLAERAAYDPWESVEVLWDSALTTDAAAQRINPWELEIDPDEETRRAEEAKRQAQAAARAQRARTGARRAADDPEADTQAAEWAAEDAKLAEVMAMGDRAALLLGIHKSRPDYEGGVFNEAAYGMAAQAAYQATLFSLGGPLMAAGALMPYTTNAAASFAAPNATNPASPSPATTVGGFAVPWFGAPGLPAALVSQAGGGFGGDVGEQHTGVKPTPHVVSPTASQGEAPASIPATRQTISPKVLEALRIMNREQFTTMLTNFYRGLKGKYKVPIFAHKELDLHAVWWAVMEEGGYEEATSKKMWRDICRKLPFVDLSGQTSASYNMRSNYERCLLEFENYLASGQYEADLATGRAPAHTYLMDPGVARFTIPGAGAPNASTSGGSAPSVGPPVGMVQFVEAAGPSVAVSPGVSPLNNPNE